MGYRNYITLYRYMYRDKVFKMDKFEYCEECHNITGCVYYEVYSGPKSYARYYRVYHETNLYQPGLDKINDQYIMWSLSPDKKEEFLMLAKDKKCSKLKEILGKVTKYEEEINYLDEELLTCD